MKISLVVAVAENGIIGADNGLPWRLKGDMKHFKATTMGKPVIMGRKTFESIGRPLPGRTNIVLTRGDADVPEGVAVVRSLSEAFAVARRTGAEEACVIGGGDIYAQAMPYADIVHLTRVHMDVDGDTSFPPVDPDAWKQTTCERVDASDGDSSAFSILRLERQGSPAQAIQ